MWQTEQGEHVEAVDADTMLKLDRMATSFFGLELLQMMENAGRALADTALRLCPDAPILVLCGRGGNGGGGLCAVRHLALHQSPVSYALSAVPASGTAADLQLGVLQASGRRPLGLKETEEALACAGLVVDALIGYSLSGSPRGRTAELISAVNDSKKPVLSLDVPSGLEATTGASPGLVMRTNVVLTLALPKTGLQGLGCELLLARIGIPDEAYARLGLKPVAPVRSSYVQRLVTG